MASVLAWFFSEKSVKKAAEAGVDTTMASN
jgi:hypothetical protein